MKQIFIVGGNGFARECYHNLMIMIENGCDAEFAGFLGYGGYGETVDYKSLQKYYKGDVSEHEFKENEFVIIGAGYPDIRKKIYNDLKSRNVRFFTIYSGRPVKNSVKLGEANIIVPPAYISCDVEIGNCNVFNGEVGIGHDVKIGDFNFFGPRSNILGGVVIGSENIIGVSATVLPNAKIGNNNKISPVSVVYKGCKNDSYLHGNPAIKVGSTLED